MPRRSLALGAVALAVIAGVLWWRLDRVDVATPAAQRSEVPANVGLSAEAGGRARAAMPPAGRPLATVYGQLRGAAEQGSTTAACRIAQEISRCRSELDALEPADILAKAPNLAGHKQALAEAVLDNAAVTRDHCAGAGAVLDDGYRFQAIAAGAGGAFRRWLVLRPLLDQQDFLSDIDDWKDYETRAKAYVSEALEKRSGDDLPLLLSIYSPAGVDTLRPPYRVDDRITFLALSRIGEQSDVAFPLALKEAADDVAAGLTRDEDAAVRRRILELGPRWVVNDSSQLPQDVYRGATGDSFCK